MIFPSSRIYLGLSFEPFQGLSAHFRIVCQAWNLNKNIQGLPPSSCEYQQHSMTFRTIQQTPGSWFFLGPAATFTILNWHSVNSRVCHPLPGSTSIFLGLYTTFNNIQIHSATSKPFQWLLRSTKIFLGPSVSFPILQWHSITSFTTSVHQHLPGTINNIQPLEPLTD